MEEKDTKDGGEGERERQKKLEKKEGEKSIPLFKNQGRKDSHRWKME